MVGSDGVGGVGTVDPETFNRELDEARERLQEEHEPGDLDVAAGDPDETGDTFYDPAEDVSDLDPVETEALPEDDAPGGIAAHGDPDELRGEAGEPTGDVEAQQAATRAPAPAVDLSEEIRVDGTTQLTLNTGGKAPTVGKLKLRVGAITLAPGRAYEKGARLYFEGVMEVRGITQMDKVDKKAGVVVDCEQTHVADIVDLVVREA
jgi:hypothetical protein